VDLYKVAPEGGRALPDAFKRGSMLVYKRETPGYINIIRNDGILRWYHLFRHTGVKVAHYTKHGTILCILATMDYPTSYGNEILELSLAGDTVFHLKKGEGDFQQTIHHEILRNPADQYVTLCSKDSIMDLSAVGGKPRDTVKGDGILVLDRRGRKVWGWSVFGVLDPLKEKNIAKDAKDWMHANILFIDEDGNYLVSFYNNGQIWKINAVTGTVIWKLGRGGDFPVPAGAVFDQGHAVHINAQHRLMLFDNGASRQRSQVLAFDVDESGRKISLDWRVQLPKGTFTDRMGSAYTVDDSTVLVCVSKQNNVFLMDKKGSILWRMTCANTPYRVEFIPYGAWQGKVQK
jgi:hypothetical protein